MDIFWNWVKYKSSATHDTWARYLLPQNYEGGIHLNIVNEVVMRWAYISCTKGNIYHMDDHRRDTIDIINLPFITCFGVIPITKYACKVLGW